MTEQEKINKLKALISLLSDPSENVQSHVKAAISQWGPDLKDELHKLDPPPTMLEWIKLSQLMRQFEIGQLVCHRKYGYRGVVVAADDLCCASDEWYQKNKTQPARHQPWYHVLIDDSATVTYAAQTSLEADPEPAEIQHPLLQLFFLNFNGTSYTRNEMPWPDERP